jgi:hypothetical protein
MVPALRYSQPMTDVSNVLDLARDLYLSEETVDTPEVVVSMAEL